MNYDRILSLDSFQTTQYEKETVFLPYLKNLTEHHKSNSTEYRLMMDAIGMKVEFKSLSEIPFLPVSLFKEIDLKSVESHDVFKTMTSSGTTGQLVSRIYLDKNTAINQQKTLVKIVSSFVGADRVPLLIIDSPSVLKDRNMFSARGAGILGFSIFGLKVVYALDENMKLNIDAIQQFANDYSGQRKMIFGFTFMIWQHFIQELDSLRMTIDLSGSVLFHGGGWKKLEEQRVTNQAFKNKLLSLAGVDHVHDYYGMVEQTGTIYVECEEGYLHTSAYSDIIIRDFDTFSPTEIGEQGIIQVISLLPESYPGHSLLTEDQGILHGIDDCKCGRKGKYFTIQGRLKNAEIRGCSDTYAVQFK